MSKFKNTEELEKAYQELEKEFTKKSQKLANYEKTNYVTLLNREMDSLLDDYAKRRITDLEAKLVESEERAERYKSWHNEKAGECAELNQQLTDLQQEQIKEMQEHQEAMQVADKRIKELQSQLALTEDALELACEKLPMEYEYCSSHPERYNLQDEYGSDEPYWVEEGGCEWDDPARCLECVINYFKTKAKELIDG